MKNKMLFFMAQVLVTCIINVSQTHASNIIPGNNAVQVQRYPHVLYDGEKVQGLVRLSNGLTVLAGAIGTMDTCLSVSGAMDLRETGTLRLLGDLYLDSNVTLSGGGTFKGLGNTIFMSGDLTLPSNKVLYFMDNAVLDGRDHNLIIDTNAQIFLDSAVSVTLKNMTIKNKRNGTIKPPVILRANTSQLTLDNVIIAPVNDFAFPQGQIFINNDVIFTGKSAFIYQSTKPCYINSESCLYFDHNTTFSFAPASTNKDLIVLNDPTSTLYLDGCDLKVTYTGLRLTTGRLICDNKVNFDSRAVVQSFTMNAGTPITKSYSFNYSADWSPNGKYLAIGGNKAAEQIKIYYFDGTSLTDIPDCTINNVNNVLSVKWSHNGDYLAIGGYGGEIKVYSFTGTEESASLANIPGCTKNYFVPVQSVDWNPNDDYLAICGQLTSKQIQVYSFDGTSLTELIACNKDFGDNAWSVNWSHNGNYLAVGGKTTGSQIKVYSFDEISSSLTVIPGCTVSYGNDVKSVNWSFNDDYLAIGGKQAAEQVKVYSFDQTTLASIPGCTINYGSDVNSVNWNDDSQYLAIGGWTAGKYIQVFKFDETSLTEKLSLPNPNGLFTVDWRANTSYLVGGGVSDFYAYPINLTGETQTMYNTIIFGNKNAGSSYNLDATLLGRCNIKLSGLLNDDSV